MAHENTPSTSAQPVRAETLNLLAQEYLKSKQPLLFRFLQCPLQALYITIFVLVFFTLAYVLLIATEPNDCSEVCQQKKAKSFVSKGIYVDPPTLDIVYLEHQLNTELTPSKIEEIKQTLQKKYGEQKHSLVASRKEVAKFADKLLSDRSGQLFLPELSAQVKLYLNQTKQSDKVAEFPTQQLYEAFKQRRDDNSLPPFTDQAFAGDSSGQDDLNRLWALLAQQYKREKTYINSVNTYIASMDSYMSFTWLATKDWLFHLIFWTWFGVLINNAVWLSRLVKNRQEEQDLEYSPCVYLTLYPRLVIAPFISIVFLAMVSAGIANFDITNLNNLPAFLVAAFFLGFMSESVTLRMRQLFNKLLDSISYQQQPTLTLAQIEPVSPYAPMKNDSFIALEANIRAIVKADLHQKNIQNQLVTNARLDKK